MKDNTYFLARLLTTKRKLEPKIAVKSAGGIIGKHTIFELVRPRGMEHLDPCYAVMKKDRNIKYLTEVSADHAVYKPYKRVPWKLPQEPSDYGSPLDLWENIRKCLVEHLDHPDPTTYDTLACWIMATWLREAWKSVPYIFTYGPHETGKTRTLEILSELSYRGWLALYVTSANLYRPLEDWKPTLFLDEAEVYGDRNDILSILNGGYRLGWVVPRQVETSDGYKTVFHDVFGFKALAGTRQLAQTLASRCLTFQMSRATRKIRLFIDKQETQQLRNQLLNYRFDVFSGIFWEEKKGEELKVVKDSEGRGALSIEEFAEKLGSGRLAELFWPLYTVAPTIQLKQKMIEYARELGKSRMEELGLSDEALVLSAILKAKELGYMKNNNILLKQIVDIINEGRDQSEWLSNRFVGAVCSRLGFRKTRVHGGLTAIVWSEQLIERLKHDPRYKLCFEDTLTS